MQELCAGMHGKMHITGYVADVAGFEVPLYFCACTGSIPSSLATNVNLETLDVKGNQLTRLPREWITGYPQVRSSPRTSCLQPSVVVLLAAPLHFPRGGGTCIPVTLCC